MSLLLIIGVVLLILWLLGFVGVFSLGSLLYVALVIGAILVIIWLLKAVFKLF
jgi:hypothetical protein